ncbi:MAG: GGDEF domain-containing protein [Betaproteobacteria bacterium]|nr:GGDEF domain-containing protein [Betaproteobacteria bacterium]
MIEAKLMLAIMDAINIGLIVLDQEECVVCWNSWVENTSGISFEMAQGKRLVEIFPELDGKRTQGAVRNALRNGYASILSQSLNKAPFPLYARDPDTNQPARLQQAIYVQPLVVEEITPHCMIQIFDVTAAVNREKILREQAQEMRAFSHIDGLTGVANRRRYDECVEDEFHRARRSGTPLSLIMIDIDYFKAYNDSYGHQAGDACLVRIAETLNAALHRSGDLLARYGGEEFVVVLPGVDRQGAYLIAENMRGKVAELNVVHQKSPDIGQVTISLGVVSLIPSQVDKLDELQLAADKALYQAKRAGRNQVVVYGEQPA